MEEYVKYSTIDGYKEGVVVNELDNQLRVLVMRHVVRNKVQDVWLGEADTVSAHKVQSLASTPPWHNSVGVALECFMDAVEVRNDYNNVR